MLIDEYGVSIEGDKNVPELVVMVVQCYECTKKSLKCTLEKGGFYIMWTMYVSQLKGQKSKLKG